MKELRYQIKVDDENQRTELKIAFMRIKNFTDKKNIADAVIELARQIQEKEI